MKFSDIPRNPDAKTLRQFAVLCLLFFGGIGSYQLHKGIETWPWVFIALALSLGLPGIFLPKILKPVFVTWMILVFPIGWVMFHLLLVLLFYFVFTPLGLVLRVFGHDPLRSKKTKLDTYWTEKEKQPAPHRYLKQF